MSDHSNPAWAAFLEFLPQHLVWAQVLIQRSGDGFSLRHAADESLPDSALISTPVDQLRSLANFNQAGQFRPLKSQPDLRRGWFAFCPDAEELHRALSYLYPHSVVDWFAAGQSALPPVQNYREFTNRQTGMYRVTQLLTDQQAADVIRAGCHPGNCLKRRLWTVESLPPDPATLKSLIPCLEPCAVLLEFARKAARIEQEEPAPVQLRPSEVQTLQEALANVASVAPVGDFGSPSNPRRLQLLLEKLRASVQSSPHEDKA